MASKLLINEPPLQVLPSLAAKIGLNEAIFLQQLHYWLTPTAKYKPHYKEYDSIIRPWIFNTYHAKGDNKETGWQANFPFWSVSTIKRIVSSLKSKNLLIVTDQFNAHSTNRTLWYTINYDELNHLEMGDTLDSVKMTRSECQNDTLRADQNDTLMTETTTETTTENMPQSGENDFPDLFGDQSPTNEKPQNGKPELTEAEQTHLQTFGVLPDQINPDDKIYAIRQEIAADGWVIYGLDVEMAIAHFVQAMRVYHPEFIIPKDTSTRKRWYKDVGGHLQNYSLKDLANLYKRAIIKMREAKLSCWHPGSLTKWALPEVANEIAQPDQDIDLGKGFYV